MAQASTSQNYVIHSKEHPQEGIITFANLETTDEEIELIKSGFNEKLHAHFLSTRPTTLEESPKMTSLWSHNCLDPLILRIQKEKEKSCTVQGGTFIYHFKGKFLMVGNWNKKERLFLKDKDGKFKVILPWEDIFDIFWEIHKIYDHPNTWRLKHILQDDYIINEYAVQSIYEVCYKCSGKRMPYFRCTLDLTTLNGVADYTFTHIMIYQDMCTGYIHLRPLSTGSGKTYCTLQMESEICEELLTIFMDFGPPKEVLISHDIFLVALDEINQLTTFAPIPIAVTRVNKEKKKCDLITKEITEWMKKNDFKNWSIACYGVQAYLNNQNKKPCEPTPYDMIFKKIESRRVEDLKEVEFVTIDEERVFVAPVACNAASVEPDLDMCIEGVDPNPSSPGEGQKEELINDEFAGSDISDELVETEAEDPLAIDLDSDL